jgi:hypothetical protein
MIAHSFLYYVNLYGQTSFAIIPIIGFRTVLHIADSLPTLLFLSHNSLKPLSDLSVYPTIIEIPHRTFQFDSVL